MIDSGPNGSEAGKAPILVTDLIRTPKAYSRDQIVR